MQDIARLSKECNLSIQHIIYILEEVFSIKYSDIILSDKSLKDLVNYQKLQELLIKTKEGKSIDHIIGYKYFYGRKFKVGRNLLAPRPDSEVLIEEVLKVSQKTQINKLLELGIGTGCLFTTITCEVQSIQNITCFDINPEAIEVSKENFTTHCNGEYNIIFHLQDGFNLQNHREFDYDMLISNPPYIKTKDITTLGSDVQNEDIGSLDGGEDGFYFYRKLNEIVPKLIKKSGHLIIEIGFNQAEDIKDIMKNLKFIKLRKDYAGQDRVMVFQV